MCSFPVEFLAGVGSRGGFPWWASLRHRGGGAGGGFDRRGGGFGGGFGGGEGDFSRGRKFSSEDLRLLLVDLLAEAPRHGYELIKLLETRSNGFYAPSPGMVYPSLTYLEEIGHATVTVEGNRKGYSLTAAGLAYLEENRGRVDVIWARLNFLGKKMGLVRQALAGQASEENCRGEQPRHELTAARLTLEQQLVARREASADEQLRIAHILERAAQDIADFAAPGSQES